MAQEATQERGQAKRRLGRFIRSRKSLRKESTSNGTFNSKSNGNSKSKSNGNSSTQDSQRNHRGNASCGSGSPTTVAMQLSMIPEEQSLTAPSQQPSQSSVASVATTQLPAPAGTTPTKPNQPARWGRRIKFSDEGGGCCSTGRGLTFPKLHTVADIIPHHEDLTAEQRSQMWYSKKELRRVQAETKEAVDWLRRNDGFSTAAASASTSAAAKAPQGGLRHSKTMGSFTQQKANQTFGSLSLSSHGNSRVGPSPLPPPSQDSPMSTRGLEHKSRSGSLRQSRLRQAASHAMLAERKRQKAAKVWGTAIGQTRLAIIMKRTTQPAAQHAHMMGRLDAQVVHGEMDPALQPGHRGYSTTSATHKGILSSCPKIGSLTDEDDLVPILSLPVTTSTGNQNTTKSSKNMRLNMKKLVMGSSSTSSSSLMSSKSSPSASSSWFRPIPKASYRHQKQQGLWKMAGSRPSTPALGVQRENDTASTSFLTDIASTIDGGGSMHVRPEAKDAPPRAPVSYTAHKAQRKSTGRAVWTRIRNNLRLDSLSIGSSKSSSASSSMSGGDVSISTNSSGNRHYPISREEDCRTMRFCATRVPSTLTC